MNISLYLAALFMTVSASAFAAGPLIMSGRRRNAGFARLPVLAVIAVFGFAIALYAVIGRPDLLGNTERAPEGSTTTNSPTRTGSGEKAASVDSLLGGLEARLEENPDDGKGWLLLAQTYRHLGRNADSAAAYEKASALGVTDAKFSAELGSDRSSADPTPIAAIATIAGRVSVAAEVAERIDPGAVVFVVATAGDSPMPLAVIRRSAAELPFDFVLSDEDSMVRGRGVSTADSVLVAAKISFSGDALDTDPGLEASSIALDPRSADRIELVIGRPDAD